MKQVLFHWRGLTIYSYTAFLYLGLLAGVVAGNIAARFQSIERFHLYWATLILIIAALVGARLLFVITHWHQFRGESAWMCGCTKTGAAMYGGLPLALVCSVPVLAVLHLDFRQFWDISVFTILAGMFFVRIGCLLNGCCSGRASDSRWAMFLPGTSGIWERRIPSQLLEAGCAGLLLFSAALIWPHLRHTGDLFLLACVGYASARFLMEFLRERETGSRMITLAQYCSALVISVSVLVFVIRRSI